MIVVQKMLQTRKVSDAAEKVIGHLAKVSGEREDLRSNDEMAAKTAGTIDEYLKASWNSADSLHKELVRHLETEKPEDRLRKIVREKQDDITLLDETWNVFGWAEKTDEAIVELAQILKEATSSVLDYLPDAVLQWEPDARPKPENVTQSAPSYFIPQFIPPRLLLRRLWISVWALRRIASTGWGTSKYFPKDLEDLSAPELSIPTIRKLMDEKRAPMMETQLWRLQDLRSGGLVYTLELFMEAVKSSGKAAFRESSKELYSDTFKFLTRKRDGYSVWTEKLLVDLLQRVLPAKGEGQVPDYFIDHFINFLSEVLPKKNEPHIEDAMSQIKAYHERTDKPSEVAREALSEVESPRT
jgi:hypothetical protein